VYGLTTVALLRLSATLGYIADANTFNITGVMDAGSGFEYFNDRNTVLNATPVEFVPSAYHSSMKVQTAVDLLLCAVCFLTALAVTGRNILTGRLVEKRKGGDSTWGWLKQSMRSRAFKESMADCFGIVLNVIDLCQIEAPSKSIHNGILSACFLQVFLMLMHEFKAPMEMRDYYSDKKPKELDQIDLEMKKKQEIEELHSVYEDVMFDAKVFHGALLVHLVNVAIRLQLPFTERSSQNAVFLFYSIASVLPVLPMMLRNLREPCLTMWQMHRGAKENAGLITCGDQCCVGVGGCCLYCTLLTSGQNLFGIAISSLGPAVHDAKEKGGPISI
jgi:hypothetical protein